MRPRVRKRVPSVIEAARSPRDWQEARTVPGGLFAGRDYGLTSLHWPPLALQPVVGAAEPAGRPLRATTARTRCETGKTRSI